MLRIAAFNRGISLSVSALQALISGSGAEPLGQAPPAPPLCFLAPCMNAVVAHLSADSLPAMAGAGRRAIAPFPALTRSHAPVLPTHFHRRLPSTARAAQSWRRTVFNSLVMVLEIQHTYWFVFILQKVKVTFSIRVIGRYDTDLTED